MKLKSKVITGFIVFSLLYTGHTVRAQGIYSDNKLTDNTNDDQQSGSFFRDDDDDWGNGGSGDGKDPAPGDDSPVGEGMLILTLLSGGYALIKRKGKEKHES